MSREPERICGYIDTLAVSQQCHTAVRPTPLMPNFVFLRGDDDFGRILRFDCPTVLASPIPQFFEILMLALHECLPILIEPRHNERLRRSGDAAFAIRTPNKFRLFSGLLLIAENPVFHHAAPCGGIKFSVVQWVLAVIARGISYPFGDFFQLRIAGSEDGAVQKIEVVQGKIVITLGSLSQFQSSVNKWTNMLGDQVLRTAQQPLSPDPPHAT